MRKPAIVVDPNPSKETLEKLGVADWPIWEKDVSNFNWWYAEDEVCYVLQGRVRVDPAPGSGEPVEFGPGALVSFAKGLSCVWTITERVRKHYKLG
jgi:hypothetical protein